jgi:WhiB family redox-sensing transcriptional regulator
LEEKEWLEYANCKSADTRVFFILREDKDQRQRRAAAYAICKVCPVQRECLEYAIVNNEVGIWGGTSERDRRLMRRHWNSSITPRRRLAAW